MHNCKISAGLPISQSISSAPWLLNAHDRLAAMANAPADIRSR
jgi:hypothetical protein